MGLMSREMICPGPEFRMFRPPTDTIGGSETPIPEILRHITSYGELRYNPATGETHSPLLPEGKQDIALAHATSKTVKILTEGKLLEALIKNPRAVLMQEELVRMIYPTPSCWPKASELNNLRVAMFTLRDRLGECPEKKIIHTVKLRGFTIATPEDLISPTNPKTISYQTSLGEILFNDDALLTTSPLGDKDAKPIELTPQEAHVLKTLMTKGRGHVAHGTFELSTPDHVRLYIYYLRKKLKDSNQTLIETVPGGFRLARAA